MSLPSFPAIETLKQWIDYWRKLKGKRVRVWFRRASYDSSMRMCVVMSAGNIPEGVVVKTSEFNIGDKPLDEVIRKVEMIESIEGTISDVLSSPFGLILENTSMWLLVKGHSGKDVGEFVLETDTDKEVKKVFIPMCEIARVDFLEKK